MGAKTLYLMLGYPGAGKTTTARVIHQLTGATHLWADQIRNERFKNPTHSHQENLELYDYLNDLTADLLDKDQSVIFDTGFNFYKDRQNLRNIAKSHNAKTELVWVKTDKSLSRQRATHPGHAERNTYDQSMSLERFNRITEDFEEPQANELTIVVDGTKVTPEYIKQLLKL